MKDVVRRITRRNRGVSLERVLEALGRYTDGWVGYYRLAQTPSVYAEFDEWIRHRLRCSDGNSGNAPQLEHARSDQRA